MFSLVGKDLRQECPELKDVLLENMCVTMKMFSSYQLNGKQFYYFTDNNSRILRSVTESRKALFGITSVYLNNEEPFKT